MMTLHCFIDTNIFLHFRRVDELDWSTLLKIDKSTGVVLLITPVVVRELDDEKVSNRAPRLRRRASDILRWLEDRVSRQDEPLRQGLWLRIVAHEPQLDFATHRLSAHINDDHLIATVLEYRVTHPDSRCVVVSDDVGFRLKCPAYDIDVVRPSDEARLAPEPDPAELRARELEAELQALTARRPKLLLGLAAGPSPCRVKKPAEQMLSPQELQVRAAEAEELARHHYRLPNSTRSEYTLHQTISYTRAFQQYLERLQRSRAEQARSIKLEFRLSNEGTAPATKIAVEVALHCDGARFTLDMPLAEAPPPSFCLSPEEEWKLSAQRLDANRGVDRVTAGDTLTLTKPSHAFIQVGSLNHHHALQAHPIYLLADSPAQLTPFKLTYRITCAELPALSEGSLHVIVE